MSIAVGFTNQSKRENSTKQLTMSETHNCVYKNGCDMLKPTLLLELNLENFPDYTAFKIENRYYNVTTIRSVRDNLFEISGDIDVLATYKSNILATTAYVIFDSTSNSELVDKRLPMKTSKNVQVATTPCPFDPIDGGCYILSLTGSNNTTGVYKVNYLQLAQLIEDVEDIKDNLFNYDEPQPEPPTPPTGTSVGEAIQYIADYFGYVGDWWAWLWEGIKHPITQFFGTGNIPENIRECRFIPFNVGTTLEANDIYLGTWKTNLQFGKLNNDTVHRTVTVSIPWQTNDWRRRSPFTNVYVYLPYIGMERLSSENLVGESSLTISYTLALRDGTLLCTVSAGGEIIGQYPGNVGASVPVGISNINLPKVAQSLISTAGHAMSGDSAGSGLAAINAISEALPNLTCIGGLDGLASTAANQNITCYTVFHDTIAPPNTELATIGSPTMKPKSLATLANYVQTMAASVDGAMTSEERNRLNRLLDSGIYIE